MQEQSLKATRMTRIAQKKSSSDDSGRYLTWHGDDSEESNNKNASDDSDRTTRIGPSAGYAPEPLEEALEVVGVPNLRCVCVCARARACARVCACAFVVRGVVIHYRARCLPRWACAPIQIFFDEFSLKRASSSSSS